MNGRTSGAPILILALIVIFLVIGLFLGFFGFSFKRLMWGPLAGGGLFPLGPAFGLFGFGTLLVIVLAFWVGTDANRRGMNGVLWGLLVLFTFVVGLIVYLIVVQGSTSPASPPSPAETVAGARGAIAAGSCPQCGGKVESGFQVCPFCGAALGQGCPGCSRATRSEWKLCPYCSTRLERDA